jgi:hypothetical protein
MDLALSQRKRRALGRDAGAYELVEPVLQIAPAATLNEFSLPKFTGGELKAAHPIFC